jgi:C1A family cysteine protease
MEDFFASFDWASYATKHRLKGRIHAIAHFVQQNKFSLKITRLPEEFLTIKNPAPKSLPVSVDLRSKFPICYDQGQLGSCTANALVAAYEYLVPGINFSRLFLYHNERDTTNYETDVYIHDGINALETHGIPPEKDWPYTISKFATNPPQEVYTSALKHKVTKAYNVTQTVNTMKSLLVSGTPFVFGFVVFREFQSYTVSVTGLVPYPNSASVALGGYACLCCGFNDNIKCPNSPPGAWLCRNSWGTGWGLNGYFWLSYNYLVDHNLSSDIWYLETTTG